MAPPRMFLLLARCAPVGVIFRRGPSKRVELVKWNTGRDSFERGHWFHGRLYERRCDLSPHGDLLVYFASKFTGRTVQDREYTYAWTAVSRPPWLTALALWPKGDCWHGGGLFIDDRRLLLNHLPTSAEPHPKHRPKGIRVEPNVDAHGEDDPLFSRRLERDGWRVEQEWEVEYLGLPELFRTRQPERRIKRHPAQEHRIVLERRVDGVTYRERFSLEATGGAVHLPEGRLDWVDWDHGGRLILLRGGAVYAASVTGEGVGTPTLLIDLAGDKPQERVPPAEALAWPS